MADELDAFLKEGAPAAVETPAEPAEAHAEPQAAEPPPPESKAPETPPEAPREATAKAGEKPAKEAEPEEDDAALPVTGGDNRTVPFSALEKVRNDWKSKAAAAQAQADELRRQLEEAKQAVARPPQPPPQPVQQLPPPDFNTNPAGYIQHLVQTNQKQILNERLNLSEAILREKIGSEKVDEYQKDFRAFAEKDPTLWDKLYSQPTPYQWLTGEIDRRRMQAEIGDDPTAFEARIREKVLAEIAAAGNGAGNGTAATRPALPAQSPSLAAARSVAGRTSPAFTGPPAMSELFPGVENRRRQR